nr:hypothetical protein [[Eubacterium] tenue]
MRDITEELSKATSVPYSLWEFEDLMKDTGFKHKNLEDTNEYKEGLHRKNKRVFRRFKKKNK